MTQSNPLITAQQAHEMLKKGELVLIDVRSPQEWAQTGIPEGSTPLTIHGPGFLEGLQEIRQENPDRRIAVICRTGNRTGWLINELKGHGIDDLLDVSEGLAGGPAGRGWAAEGLPLQEWTE